MAYIGGGISAVLHIPFWGLDLCIYNELCPLLPHTPTHVL